MGQLALRPQHPVEGRFGADIALLIGQSGHDLARRQVAKLGRVGHRQQRRPLQRRELVRRRLVPQRAPVRIILGRQIPTLQGAFAEAQQLAGRRQSSAAQYRLGHQRADRGSL